MMICVRNKAELNLDGQPCENAYDYLTKERNVTQLLHFTPVDNISTILEQGILPHWKLPASAVVLDHDRLDGYSECSCFSATFPNYKMLYYRRQHFNYTFAILGIDPRIIADKGAESVIYFAHNAAKTGIYGRCGIQGATKMFYDIPISGSPTIKSLRPALKLPDNYTTDPQAEILIRGTVPPEYISCIYVKDYADKDLLLQALGGSCPVPVEIAPHIFEGRHDNAYWRNK